MMLLSVSPPFSPFSLTPFLCISSPALLSLCVSLLLSFLPSSVVVSPSIFLPLLSLRHSFSFLLPLFLSLLPLSLYIYLPSLFSPLPPPLPLYFSFPQYPLNISGVPYSPSLYPSLPLSPLLLLSSLFLSPCLPSRMPLGTPLSP